MNNVFALIEPSAAFNLSYAVNSIAMPLIGGMTSWLGPLIGAVLLGSVQAVLGALIVALAVRQGPYAMPQSRLQLSQVLEIARNRRVRRQTSPGHRRHQGNRRGRRQAAGLRRRGGAYDCSVSSDWR